MTPLDFLPNGHQSNQNKDNDTSLNVNETDQTSLSATLTCLCREVFSVWENGKYIYVLWLERQSYENNPYDVIRLVSANASNIEHKARITRYLWKV